MKTKLTLLERILSDTPGFFKQAQLLGLALAGLGTSLTQIEGISPQVSTILISTGTTIAVISQFAVKQHEIFSQKDNNEN